MVTATKSDSTAAVVNGSDLQVSAVDFTTAGTKTVTVTYEGKTATFDIMVTAPVESFVSKSIQNLDFSTKYATSAMLVGKTLTTSQFAQAPKSFALEVATSEGTKTLPITLNWNLSTEVPWGDGISGVINSYAQMKFGFYDYPLVSWKNSNDEKAFNVVALATGSNVKLKATGLDASYFFEDLSTQGTDEDTSKNRTFTVSDGTNSATILLDWGFSGIEEIVETINYYLTSGNVSVTAEKVNNTQFKFTSTGGILVIDGNDKSEFFE